MQSKAVILSFLLFSGLWVSGQDHLVIDKVIAVVGNEVILKSDLEGQLVQYRASGNTVNENTPCEILEELLYQGLLLHQAGVDSVEVGESQVEAELDRRLRYFISQIGSEKKLEEYYKKSILEIKAEMYDPVKNQLLVQQMQSKVTNSVKISPAEVRQYFHKIPKDSIPYINSQVQIAHIVKQPDVNEDAVNNTKEKLASLRQRVLDGEDFGALAYLYSDDPGSAKKNGELGMINRKDLVSEFSAVAFSLNPGEISEIVETQFGFHIIQLIERRGQQVNVRHILLKPKVSSEDMAQAKQFLDSLSALIEADSISFEEAARLHSDDAETKGHGGKLVNPMTGATAFEMDQLGEVDPSLFFVIDKLNPGEISQPVVMEQRDGTKAYRLIKLVSRTDPHRANLRDDYQRIQEAAVVEKENRIILDWVNRKVKRTYLKIEEEYKDCKFEHNWLVSQQDLVD